jgi:hypothetical protein
MKLYPKIPNSKGFPAGNCLAFEKYDGSNLRFLWTKKRGFYKFGTRQRLFDHTDPVFGPAIPVFMETYSESLGKLFTDHKRFRSAEHILAFTEFLGPNSFAGLHLASDPKEVILFDISVHRFGFLSPREFVNLLEGIKTAKVVYDGKFNGTFTQDVREGKYGVKEGVVCKTGAGGTDLYMCKVKTYAYLEKLKKMYQSNWQDFWE